MTNMTNMGLIAKRKNGSAVELLGPKPPDNFVDNGCTMSPDGWWRPACRVHDYEYCLTSVMVKVYQLFREDREYQHAKALWKRIKERRRDADQNLKQNIRLLSDNHALKAVFAWWVSRRYYGAVRRWGRFFIERN